MMGNMGYGQERLKDIVEKEAEEGKQPTATKEEAKEQQQVPEGTEEQQQDDDNEQFDTV